MNIKHHCLAAVAVALASAGQLSAQTVTATFIETSPSLTLKGTFDGGINTKTLNSGVAQFDKFEAFCIEPYQVVYSNQQVTFQSSSTFSTPEIDAAIAKLVSGYYSYSSQTNQEAAAIQWAIWEVVVDGTNNPSLTTGNNQVFDNATAQLGQQYLNNLDRLPEANVVFLTNSKYQDFVTVVPEPSSSALLGLGIVGFLLRRKRS